MRLKTTGNTIPITGDLMHPTYSATKAALHSLIFNLRQVLETKQSSSKVFEMMLPLPEIAPGSHEGRKHHDLGRVIAVPQPKRTN